MIVGVIQARMGSKRLPGKVMAEILGTPMIERIAERVGSARTIDRVAVATTTEASDDVLAAYVAGRGIGCYRGRVDDIVDRLSEAARQFEADVLVRIWGDCPFADPEVIDQTVGKLLTEDLDYASNFSITERTFPSGLELEVYRRRTLEAIQQNTDDEFYREFPVEYLTANASLFRLGVVRCEGDLSDVHLTVDYPQDMESARAVYASLYRPGEVFGFREIVSLVRGRPESANERAELPRNVDYYQKKRKRQ